MIRLTLFAALLLAAPAVAQTPDDAQAFASCQKAAATGDLAAEAALGRLYITGRGTNKDVARGLALWTRAADNNGKHRGRDSGALASVQKSLGELYYAGKDVPQDYAKAYYWLELAGDTMVMDSGADTTGDAELDAESAECAKHVPAEQQMQVLLDIAKWHRAHD